MAWSQVAEDISSLKTVNSRLMKLSYATDCEALQTSEKICHKEEEVFQAEHAMHMKLTTLPSSGKFQ